VFGRLLDFGTRNYTSIVDETYVCARRRRPQLGTNYYLRRKPYATVYSLKRYARPLQHRLPSTTCPFYTRKFD